MRKHVRKLWATAAASVLMSGMVLIPASAAGASGEPFACDPGFYQVISGQLAELDPHTGLYNHLGPDYSSYNAMGYRVADGFLYGMSGTTLHRIDATGLRTDLATLDVPSGAYTGDFGDDGLLHISRGGAGWYKVDVETLTATYVPELSASMGVADVTNVHGIFYGVSSGGNLVRFDPTAGTVTNVAAVSGLPSTSKAYGAAWSTAGGNFYVGRNSGEIYQITGYTTGSPVATLVGSAPATNSNDGASCSLAVPPAGLNDVDGPESESTPQTQAAIDAAQYYTDNYETISAGFNPNPTPAGSGDSGGETTEGTYSPDGAGIGDGASCPAWGSEDQIVRQTLQPVWADSVETVIHDGVALTDFELLAGSWIEQNGTLVQQNTCGYDYTALLKGYTVENFRWETTFASVTTANQGGVVFNMSSQYTRAGAMLVDFSENGNKLRWGYYDDLGYYQSLGVIDVTNPGIGQAVKLGVEVQGTAVKIFVNDAQVGETTAPHAGGQVGLVASLADIDYSAATLTVLPAAETAQAQSKQAS